MTIDVEAAGQAIGLPPEQWKGRCFEVASAIVVAGLAPEGARPVYGHYLGEIAPGSFFARMDVGFVQHGWILTMDGRVIDPTRWVFEDVAPYVWEGVPGDEYDRGGNRLRMNMIGESPDYDPDTVVAGFSVPIESAEFVFDELLGNDLWEVSFDQLRWLAHLSPEALGEHARPVFEAIVKAGGSAFIPLDNKLEVLG